MKTTLSQYFYQFVILLITAVLNLMYSQGTPSEPFKPTIQKIPTSPEASLFERFGDIPIGYYTGTANISVPFYAINEAGVSIPIGLNYHSSGIKVADDATWVGLGWNFSGEAMITQEVRGIKDDLDNNLQQSQFPQNYDNFKAYLGPINSGIHFSVDQLGNVDKYNCLGSAAPTLSSDNAYSVISSLLEGHGQPDIYSYNFYGYSGKFYINPETDEIVLIDKNEDIQFVKNGYIGWTATTMDGNAFEFHILEKSSGQIITDLTGITFKISKIYFNTGKIATFTYIDEYYTPLIRRETAIVKSVGSNDITIPQNYIDYSINNKKTLSKIEFDNIVIDFNLESRDDINLFANNNVKRLKSIDIKSTLSNKKLKSFQFNYSYFPYNHIGIPRTGGVIDPFVNENIEVFGKRLKLDSVKEIGYDINGVENTSKNPYKFEYDISNTMPVKNSFAVDFYGYYNGEHNDKFLPDLSFFEYQHNVVYKNDYMDFGLYYNYTGANRYTDISKSGAYMLNKIIYPTGGYTTFSYGPNIFSNQFIPDNVTENSMKRHVDVMDNNQVQNVTSNFFTVNKNTYIKISNVINPTNVTFAAYTYQQMLPCYILLYKVKMVGGSPQITNIKEWNLSTVLAVDFESNGGKTWEEEILIEYDSNPTTKFFIKVYMPDVLNNPLDTYHSSNVRSYIDFYSDEGIDKTTNYGCGVRVNEIKNYTDNQVLVNHKKINYYEGKLLNKFEPLEVNKALFTTCAGVNSYFTFTKRVTISSDDFGLNGGYILGYGKVEEIEFNNNVAEKGKIVYEYYNVVNQTRKGYPNSPYLRNGFVKSIKSHNSSDDLLKEQIFSYTNLMSFGSYSSIKISKHIFGNTDFGSTVFVQNYIPSFDCKYSYGLYPLNSEWYMKSQIVTNEFFGGNQITTTQNYTYDDYGNIKSIITHNSANEQISTNYKYANDLPFNSMISQMLNKNMKGIPLVIENYQGTILASKNEFVYGVFTNTYPLPKETFSGKDGNLERKIKYDLYDAKGNLLQYTMENDIPVSIIWGYNSTLPIAKIENILYTSISSSIKTDIENYSTSGDDINLKNTLITLRNSLNNSFVTTFTYIHGVGVSTITDSKGYTMTYHYDAFNQLQKVTDHDGNIVTENHYHYRTQN